MTRQTIEEIFQASLSELKLTIGDSAEIEGEGIFEGNPVQGYLAVNPETESQEIVMIGQSLKFGGGLKISKKVLFPKDEAELKEFLQIIFTPEEVS